MKFKKTHAAILAAAVLAGSTLPTHAYTAKNGDTYWKIAQSYGVSLDTLLKVNGNDTLLNAGDNVLIPGIDVHIAAAGDTYWKIASKYGINFYTLLAINNANEASGLNLGQAVMLSGKTHTVKSGDTYWKIAQSYGVDFYELLALNSATEASWLSVGQTVLIPANASSKPAVSSSGTEPYITYQAYTVEQGDTLWTLAEKFAIPYTELCSANKMNDSTLIYAGMKLTIPVHHVPVTSTVSSKHGEYLDWWTQAQYVVPIGAVFQVVDFRTGKAFNAKRTTGANHADCEPLTAADTAAMKAVWGGVFSWNTRSVLIKYNGRTIAASAASYEHAGNENAAGGAWTDWRSGDYGAGYNYDWVKGNNYNGHFDIHFKNSTTHNTGAVSASHQANIKTAAGLK